jgi:hypothetical protein
VKIADIIRGGDDSGLPKIAAFPELILGSVSLGVGLYCGVSYLINRDSPDSMHDALAWGLAYVGGRLVYSGLRRLLEKEREI